MWSCRDNRSDMRDSLSRTQKKTPKKNNNASGALSPSPLSPHSRHRVKTEEEGPTTTTTDAANSLDQLLNQTSPPSPPPPPPHPLDETIQTPRYNGPSAKNRSGGGRQSGSYAGGALRRAVDTEPRRRRRARDGCAQDALLQPWGRAPGSLSLSLSLSLP